MRPSLAGMGVGRPSDGTHPRLPNRRTALPGIAVAAVVLAVGIWLLSGWFGGHVTECGFDAKGAYAKVRVGSLVGGLGSMEHEQVSVFFTYDAAKYATGGDTIKPPVLGSTTTVVRASRNWSTDEAPVEKVPPIAQKLGCSVHPPANGWQ